MEGRLIFLSHSAKDEKLALRLATALKQNGYEIWLASERVPPGAILAKSISDALEKCEIFCLLWSKNAEESGWVELEWAATLNHKKIIPLLLDETLPFILRGYRHINLIDFDFGLSELLSALNQVVRPSKIESYCDDAMPHEL